MGQKTNPIGNRLGITRGWDSIWYGGKTFGEKLVEDDKIRKYLNVRLAKANVSKIFIERSVKLVTITIHTAKPGFIIGQKGKDVDELREELKKITQKEVQINISEIKRPEIEAVLVANNIARQIEGRMSHRKAIKTAVASTMRVGAEGMKVTISGRIGGAEMSRTEHYKEGRTPLHTLRADIDYARSEAHTTYGRLGIKVWICKGEMFGKPDFYGIEAPKNDKKQRRNDRPDRGANRGGQQPGGFNRPRGKKNNSNQ